MRKMLWWGAAGLLASAGLVYLAANNCCTTSTALVVGRAPASDSALGAGLAALVSSFERGKSVTDLDDLCPTQSCKLMAEPATEECPEVPVAIPASEASEPIQIQMSQLQTAAAEGDESATEQAAALGVASTLLPGAEPVGYDGATEESEASLAETPMLPVCTSDQDIVMPKVEDGEDDNTQLMPYVEEDGEKDDTAVPFSAWLYWLKKDARKTGPAHEESDLVPGAAPAAPTVVPMEVPVSPPGTDSPLAAPMPDGVTPGVPVPNTLGPTDPTGAPNCQEDPHYHHQYPGCPYTGGCPYQGGYGYPTMKDFAPPQLEKTKKKKKKEIKATPTSMLKKLSESLLEDLKNSQVPKRCGVDTMECRPTDARVPLEERNTPF